MSAKPTIGIVRDGFYSHVNEAFSIYIHQHSKRSFRWLAVEDNVEPLFWSVTGRSGKSSTLHSAIMDAELWISEQGRANDV